MPLIFKMCQSYLTGREEFIHLEFKKSADKVVNFVSTFDLIFQLILVHSSDGTGGFL